MSIVTELQSRVRALGANFSPAVLEATQQIYRPHLDTTAVEESLDLAYGPDDRHRIDLYLPRGTPRGAVLYVHGGGFVGGGKNNGANVGRFLAREGFAAVLPNYRLAPAHGWPAGAHDVRDAIDWARKNARGAASAEVPLFVLGQSAGASHVASWLFDAETRSAPLGPVAGVMMMSGFYSAVAPLTANVSAYFGADPAVYARRSPVTHVTKLDVPVWLSVAELDPGSIAAQTFRFAEALTRCNGQSPDFAWLRGHNHVSPLLSLGSPQQDAADEILRFLRVCSRS